MLRLIHILYNFLHHTDQCPDQFFSKNIKYCKSSKTYYAVWCWKLCDLNIKVTSRKRMWRKGSCDKVCTIYVRHGYVALFSAHTASFTSFTHPPQNSKHLPFTGCLKFKFAQVTWSKLFIKIVTWLIAVLILLIIVHTSLQIGNWHSFSHFEIV